MPVGVHRFVELASPLQPLHGTHAAQFLAPMQAESASGSEIVAEVLRIGKKWV
jgi:hypothetical protein